MKRPCIVCGRAIAKRTATLYFLEPVSYSPPRERSWGGFYDAVEAKPDGHREGKKIYLANRPRTRAEAQRYVNGENISSQRSGEFVMLVNYWDGETWADKYFCLDKTGGRWHIGRAVDGLGRSPVLPQREGVRRSNPPGPFFHFRCTTISDSSFAA